MYDFLFQEEFWMETIIAAFITGISGIIAGVLGSCLLYNKKLQNILDGINTLKLHRELSQEHKELSQEHKDLSREHSQIAGNVTEKIALLNTSVAENKEITRSVKEMLIEDKSNSEYQYASLTEKQKDIINSINKLSDFGTEMQRLQVERNGFYEENKYLKEENKALKEQCLRYQKLIDDITKEEVPQRGRGMER